ncbi:hypothetical protein H633G_10314 [Metarhizium anisopliae BRIP 53284]|nr:hypothetical protein H633G_10314 [Metarhizium anisopliae BRIP 53284]
MKRPWEADPLQLSRENSTSQLLQAPTEGSLYAIERRNKVYAAMALPLGDFLEIGLKGTMWDTMLWKLCPKGYTCNKADRVIRRNEEYQPSSHQQHPVMFFGRATSWYEWVETKYFKPLSEFCDGKKVCNYPMAVKFRTSREDMRSHQQSINKSEALASYRSVNLDVGLDGRTKDDNDSEVEDADDSNYEPGNLEALSKYDNEDWPRRKQSKRRYTASHRPQLAIMRNCNATETSYVEAATPNTDSQPLRPFAYDKELIEKDYLGVFQRVHFIESEHEKKLEWVTIPPILVPQPVLLNNIFGTNRGKDIFQELNGRNPQAAELGAQTPSSKSTLASLTLPRKRGRLDMHGNGRAGQSFERDLP